MTESRLEYLVICERGDRSYGAYIPDLPGCVAVGRTKEEVSRLIREAIVVARLGKGVTGSSFTSRAWQRLSVASGDLTPDVASGDLTPLFSLPLRGKGPERRPALQHLVDVVRLVVREVVGLKVDVVVREIGVLRAAVPLSR